MDALNGKPVDERLLSAYVARADVEWDLVAGQAVIAVPKAKSRFDRLLLRIVPGPLVVFVTLDDLGTEAWLRFDGERPVREVAEALRERFRERAEPAEARAAAFALSLLQRGYASAHPVPAPAADPGRGFTTERGYSRARCRRCGHEHPLKAPAGARYLCPGCRRVVRAELPP